MSNHANRTRQPSGLPNGGQFAEENKGLSGIVLTNRAPFTLSPPPQPLYQVEPSEHVKFLTEAGHWGPDYEFLATADFADDAGGYRHRVLRLAAPLGQRNAEAAYQALRHCSVARSKLAQGDAVDWADENPEDSIMSELELPESWQEDPDVGSQVLATDWDEAGSVMSEAYDDRQRQLARDIVRAISGRRDSLNIEPVAPGLEPVQWRQQAAA